MEEQPVNRITKSIAPVLVTLFGIASCSVAKEESSAKVMIVGSFLTGHNIPSKNVEALTTSSEL